MNTVHFLIKITLMLFMVLNFNGSVYADNKEAATNLTTLLRSARAVTVNKETIGDPSKFDVQGFMEKTKGNYLKSAGKEVDTSDKLLMSLLDAIEFVVTQAQAGAYKNKWPTGSYAHKFLPARFARLTGLKFTELTEAMGSINLTTSDALLVNPDNRADDWERRVINEKFLASDWPKDKIVEEQTSDGYRLILPEYYKGGCLGCHGGEQGKSIHAEPVSGHLGGFGGAISIIIRK